MQGSKRAIPRRRPSKRPPEVPKGFAGVAAAAAMNNCTATVLQQGLQLKQQHDQQKQQQKPKQKRDGWPDAKFEGTSAKCDL